MKTLRLSLMLLTAATAFAQQWEVGGAAGGGFLPGVPVTGSMGSATAGFQSGFTAGVFVGQNLYRHISGEIRYNFLQSNLKLASGGTTATFSGNAHAVYYDVLIHTNRRESRAELYAAVGGGMKIFRGTGTEAAFQPLSQFAYFTKTQAVKPMLSVGGGVKFRLAPHMTLRTEFRDFVTPFPKDLITPAPGAKVGRLLHDFVPMVGISYEN
jgi:outer membrane protein with beta-barrel domain